MRPASVSKTPASADVEILRYFAQHPDAQDTLEGITEWWLLGRKLRPTMAEVKAGLDRLVKRGRVIAERSGDGRICYRAKRMK